MNISRSSAQKLNHFGSLIIVLFLFSTFAIGQQYIPPKDGKWKQTSPEFVGIDKDKLFQAVSFAKENEYSGSRDLEIAILKAFEYEPYHKILGPTKHRGGPAGLILKNGYIIAEWGDISRVDMTFSVTKSYLSTVAGLALDDNVIENITDPVNEYVWDGTFKGGHNSKITWEHLLNQSSDWSGTLFGLYDWADRPPTEGGIDDWKSRKLNEPGTYFKYNDVRVNALSYSLLQIWRKPLPQVLKEKIMDPIGASSTWRWYGYDDSWITVDGLKVQSVSGGGHSGGGIFINTADHGRFGLLFLRDGVWDGKQLISKEWVEKVQKPSPANDSYGYMWWLNQGNRKWEGVPGSVYYAAGFGGNYIIIDKEHDLVVAIRWLEPSKAGEFMKMVVDSIDK